MNKKPFWRRVNRGFVVSMALLAVVLLYVTVTQLMLIPERAEINRLTDGFRTLMENTSQLSDEQLNAFKSDTALTDEQKRLKSELSGLFVSDSGYIEDAVALLSGNIQKQTTQTERVTKRDKGRRYDSSLLIDQDVATATVGYRYRASGEYMDYTTQQMKPAENVEQQLTISLSCKKINGKWKIYRITNSWWGPLNENVGFNGGMK